MIVQVTLNELIADAYSQAIIAAVSAKKRKSSPQSVMA